MQHISKLCADSLRSFSQHQFGIQLKSSHAHELVAAYFGYSSRAALLADTKCPVSKLTEAEFVVLTPSAFIKERCKQLQSLPEDLPHELAEGVYSPLYPGKLVLNRIWPTFDYLGLTLANEYLNKKGYFFKDQKVQREGVKIEKYSEGVYLKVLREYISPARVLNDQQGIRGLIDIFVLKRIAGHIGFILVNHHSIEDESLEIARTKMEDKFQRSSDYLDVSNESGSAVVSKLTFADWLAKHKKRDSPLGDLASRRGFADRDTLWPVSDKLEDYQDHLTFNYPPLGATAALERAWKSYKSFLKRKESSKLSQEVPKSSIAKSDPRTIKTIKNAKPLHYSKRTIESFVAGDKAWISWEGRKAIPVTVLEVDNIYYSFRVERPLKNAGEEYHVRLDEVRSTPELACINHVTL